MCLCVCARMCTCTCGDVCVPMKRTLLLFHIKNTSDHDETTIRRLAPCWFALKKASKKSLHLHCCQFFWLYCIFYIFNKQTKIINIIKGLITPSPVCNKRVRAYMHVRVAGLQGREEETMTSPSGAITQRSERARARARVRKVL